MRLAGVILALALGAPATRAQQQAQPGKPQSKPAARSQAAELPAGAEKIRDGIWKARDKEGKTWFYSRTPFGYSRSAEDPQAAKEAPPGEQLVRVTGMEGETVRFERPTPFGGSRWTKMASDLTDEERAALDQYKTRQAAKKE